MYPKLQDNTHGRDARVTLEVPVQLIMQATATLKSVQRLIFRFSSLFSALRPATRAGRALFSALSTQHSALFLLLAFVPLLRAEPLDRRDLPAQAKWFVHVDLEAANNSVLGHAMRVMWLTRPEARDAIARAQQAFGIDPTRDIRGFTVYGTHFAPDSGILIIHGKVNRGRLLALLEKLPDYRTQSTGARTLYYWRDKSRDPAKPGHASVGAFFGEDTVIVCQDPVPLLAALDVLDGKSAALPANSPLAGASIPGAVLEAGATGLADARDLPIRSPILRQCESGTLSIGEQEGEAFVRGQVLTGSEQTASQVRALIEGARAMAQLQASQSADAALLLSPLKVSSEGNTVKIEWHLPASQIIRMIHSRESRLAAAQPGVKTP
ncbi:MAG TPA: hypothetical protein VFC78_14895 [Tepidisphaeraceae bacterium]|nr:hypothetical protein [Tepidisphaeraceae bacterium]